MNLKKFLRQNGVTKLPSGTEFRSDSVSWSKSGGYAGQKTLDKVCSQLEDAGWKRGEWRTGGIPDGSAVTNSNAYTSPDGQIVMTYSEHYGATSYDNFYGFTFKLAGNQVNETDDDFDDYDEEIDYCVQYAKDAIDRILNQPGIDDFILSKRGKIRVPLKALLPYEGGTPDEELVEAICNRCSDDKIKVIGYGSGWTLIFPDIANQMNESDEKEYTFTRSKRPQIHKYFADDETSVEEFVKKVRDAEQMVEDIFIQNSDYYENVKNPWETFCDDMCDGESPEDAFDLGYYMNQAAYDQLPEDIKKSTNLATGTCDFDAMQWLYGIFQRLMPICKDPVGESSRFGFNVGDKVELTSDKTNSFSGDVVKAGTQGEVVAVDKPMRGVIKVKVEGGKVVSVPERQLKFAGSDNEPWEKFKKSEEPRRHVRPERPEDYYMRPTSYGSPRYTGD